MRLVDLSQDIYQGMVVYPGHLKTVLFDHVSHEETAPRFTSGFSFQTKGFLLNDNGPTHVDSFSHLDPDPSALTIDQMPLDLFYGDAVCIDVTGAEPRTDIPVSRIEEGLESAPGKELVVTITEELGWPGTASVSGDMEVTYQDDQKLELSAPIHVVPTDAPFQIAVDQGWGQWVSTSMAFVLYHRQRGSGAEWKPVGYLGYGGSYGTRAGLVYLRQHGDRVRTAVLDGVAPTNMRLPLFFPRDVQRALDLLLKDCDSDEPCRAAYPNLGARLAALMERLKREPPLVKVTHPRTGEIGEIRLEPRIVANVIAATLYSPMASALIPAVVARAEQNDAQGVLALATMGDAAEPNMSTGMQLSVICAEDGPRVTDEDAAKESAGTLFGEYVMRTQRLACAFWPRGKVDAAFYEPVTSPVPTLVLSGEVDPVTPPVWGEQVAAHLPASKHLVMPGTGHTAGSTGCGLRIIRSFIDKGTTDGLDTACVAAVHRPPFFVSPAGPDPTSGKNLSRRSPAGNSAKGEGG